MIAPRSISGLTWLEALVAIVIVGLLAYCVAVPRVITAFGHSTFTQTLNNQRQLTLATQKMAFDGQTSGDTRLGWPGDTGGSYSNWVRQLVDNHYLTTNDLCKLLSAPGKIVKPDQMFTMADTGIILYAVSSNSPSNTIFLSTANFTNTPTADFPLDRSAKPYGNEGFAIFRKDGEGFVYTRSSDVTNPNIGAFAPMCR